MEVQLDFLPLCCNSKFFDMHKSIDLFAQCLHAGPCQMSSSSMPSSSIRSCLSEVTRAGSESASLSMMAHHLDCLTHYQNEMEVTWTMDEAVFNFGWSTPLTYQVHFIHTETYALNHLNAPLGFTVKYYLYNIFHFTGSK